MSKKWRGITLAVLLLAVLSLVSAEVAHICLAEDGIVAGTKQTVSTELKITTQPKSVVVSAGSVAEVTLKASGDGLTYAWYYKDAGASSFKKTNTFKGSVYSVEMTAARSGRQLYCVVGDKYGNTVRSKTVTITMGNTVKITSQPKSVTVAKGTTATLTVNASGDGLTYAWYYKDAGATSFKKTDAFKGNTYTAEMTAARTGRQIYCVVGDKYGNSVSTKTVTISMSGAVKITAQPQSVIASKGATAKVTLTASGDGLSYAWYYKDAGASVFKKTDTFKGNTYSVSMTAARSGRQLYCVVTDKYGCSVRSATVTITMGNAAKITSQPKSVTVAKGTTAKVTLKASGDGLSYTWYYRDATASSFKKTSTFKGNTYTAEMTAARSGRQLYCVVKDKYGNSVRTNTVTIFMSGGVKITTQPKSVIASKGATAKVTLKASGTGLSYAWYYKDAGATSFKKTDTFKGNTYTAEMTAARNGRQLYCVVTDKYGCSVRTDTVTLTMGNVAKITTQPKSVVTASGSTAITAVKASGDGLRYQWYYKNPGKTSFSKSSLTVDTYSVAMTPAIHGRQIYCVITDKYGTSVKTKTVTLRVKATILTQPKSATAAVGKTATVSFKAAGEGLTYQWYYKNPGKTTFSKSSLTVDTYSVEMKLSNDERQIYCVVTDKYGNTAKTDTVTLYVDHPYDEGKVLKQPTCTVPGKILHTCTVCGKQVTRPLDVLEPVFYLTVDTGVGDPIQVGVGHNGCYNLAIPTRKGYNFVGWQDAAGKAFPADGTVSKAQTVTALWEVADTTTLGQLISRADAGAAEIRIAADITVNEPIFVSYDTKIYADGDYTITRAPGYAGDIFVVGENRRGESAVLLHRKAVLTLGGGEGTLTVDGNRDNVTVTVAGSAVYVCESGTLNLRDGIRLANNQKLTNERVLTCTNYVGISSLDRAGGAAILNINGTVNMHGGVLENNAVYTENTIITNESGTEEWKEYNGCGGAVFNRGVFNMYGGTITGNEGLRGGGIYNDRIANLIAGTISDNLSHSYGGALASSSTSNAEQYIGSEGEGEGTMVFSGNHSIRAGGALYANTCSPIIIYGNTSFVNNSTESSGGAVYTAGPLTVRGTTFDGNSCVYSGGAIYHQYANPDYSRRFMTLSDCVFENNRGNLGGAVILSATDAVAGTGTKATITDCRFENNTAEETSGSGGNGGALYVTRDGELTVSGCTFDGNTAANNAGAIAIHSNAEVTLSDSTFTANKAVFGGALYTSSNSKVDMTDLCFTDNAAVLNESGSGGNGGALYIYGAATTFNNVDVRNNTAAGHAGAVYLGACEMTLDATNEFTGNTAGNHGGAFYLTYRTEADGTKTGAVLNANGATISGNSAVAGGAISIRSASQANLNGVTLADNSASGTANDASGGGAVYAGFGTLNLTDVTATGNTSAGYGGTVNAVASTVTVTGGTYSGNEAMSGGVINALSNSDVTVNGATVSGNASTYENTDYNSSLGGGALNLTGGTLTMSDTTLDGNKTGYYGGAVLTYKTTVTMDNTTVKNSVGGTGAALSFKGAVPVTITNSAITDNTASANGVVYANGCVLTMTGVTATGNTAGSGGVLYISGASTMAELRNNAISGNTAGNGGVVYMSDAAVTIADSEWKENSAALGGAVYNKKGALTLSAMTFTANSAHKTAGGAGGNGGAISMAGGTLTAEGENAFVGNTAENHAGAVYVSYTTDEDNTPVPAIFTMSGGSFSGNTALGGGAVSVRTGCEASFDGTTFAANKVTGYADKNDGNGEGGGAIYVGYGALTLTDVTADGNIAEGGFGGAVNNIDSVVTITDSTLSGNSAATGGALYASSGAQVSLSGSTVSGNHATGNGGAIYTSAKAAMSLTDTAFDGNSADGNAGAIYAGTTPLELDNVDLTNNAAGSNGGALYLTACELTVDDSCDFIGNSAAGHGGAVYLTYKKDADGNAIGAVLHANGVTFKENTAMAGGAISIRSSCEANLSGAILTGNSVSGFADTEDGDGEGGGAIYVGYGKLTLTDVTATDNTASYYGGVVDAVKGNVTVTGGTYSGNTAYSGGVIHAMTSSTITVSGATVSGNASVYENTEYNSAIGGGAIRTTGGTLTVSGSTLDGNTAGYYGGTVHSSGTTVTIDGGTVIKNSSGATGAALYFRDACRVTMDTVSVTENTSKGNGVIYVNSGTLSMTGVTATANTATQGGVLYASGGSTQVTVADSRWSGNSATNGGAVYMVSATVTLDGCEWSENTAVLGGGAYNRLGALNFTDSTFTANSATLNSSGAGGNGGVVSMAGGTLTATGGNTFAGNTAAGHAGALYVAYHESNPGTVMMTGGSFSGNTALGGGAVSIRTGCEASFDGTVFTENKVTGYADKNDGNGEGGGAIYVGYGALNLTNVTADGNTAEGGFGGAVNGIDSAITVTDSTFTNNSATNGGAIYTGVGATVTVSGSTFTGNTATNGGAVYASTNTEMTLSGTSFSGNTATAGGAVYTNSATLTLSDTDLLVNTAGGNGGAIYQAAGEMTADADCTFGENTAVGHGGAVYLTYKRDADNNAIGSVFTANGSVFDSNTAMAGGAVSARTNCELNLGGATLTGNSVSGYADEEDGDGEGGGAIYVGFGTVNLTDVTASENTASNFGGVVDAVKSTVTVSGGSFSGNSAVCGGVIHAMSKSTVTITGGTYSENTATVGGAVNADGSTVIIDGSTLSGNESTYENTDYDNTKGGGAVHTVGGTLTVSGATLDGNKTGYYGGAVLSSGTTVTIDGGTVVKNSVGATGAALYFGNSCNVTMEDVSLIDNTATGNGAIYTNSGSLAMTDVTATGNTANQGGVLFPSGSHVQVTITDCAWSDNSAKYGGALYLNGAKATISGGEMAQNTAQLGGAVYNNGGTLELDGVTFTANAAQTDANGKNGNGGAIDIVGGTVTAVGDNAFVGNTAAGHGGAVYVSYTNNDDGTKNPGVLTMTDGLFEGNTAVAGGAVSSRTACEATLTGTTFKNNKATGTANDGGGGAIYTNNNTLALSGVTMDGNESGYYGGAISALSADVTVKDNTVITNSKGITGAAIHLRNGGTCTLDTVSVTDTNASGGSGVIYITGDGTLNITKLTATGNKNNHGGVLYASGSAVITINDSTLSGNTASNNGGAIDFRSSGTLTVTSTTISGNTAKCGGALYTAGKGTVTITDSLLTGNTATTGGAIHHTASGELIIRGTTVEDNVATQSGGAVYAPGGGQITVSDSSAINTNTAPVGGALHLDQGALATIRNTTFDGNTATGGDGGAILIADSSEEGTLATTLTMTNVILQNNTASSKGGALSTDTASPNLVICATDCIFSGNAALGAGGGAVEIQNANCASATDPTEVKLVFTDCTFSGNSANTTGGVVEIRTSSCAKFDGITATNNTAKTNGGVFYVTSNYSRLYLTGTVNISGNTAKSGTFMYLYNNKYSNPPKVYTTHSNSAAWYSEVKGNTTSVVFDLTTLP